MASDTEPRQLPRRVLWHSVVPWAESAYAGQTRHVARWLRQCGVEVTLSAAAGLRGGPVEWDGFEVFGAPPDVPGAVGRLARERLDIAGGDRVVTLLDGWRLADQDLQGLGAFAWSAFETVPVSEQSAATLRAQELSPVAVSSFVADLLAEAGFGLVPVVKHGVDVDVFNLLQAGDRHASRAEARHQLKIDERRFVIGMVAANAQAPINRKCLPEMLRAVASARLEADPLVLLHVHDLVGAEAGGLDVQALVRASGLSDHQVLVAPGVRPGRTLSDFDMAIRYNAMDVLCQTSGGEGFCLPLVEAQACGVPVIASRFSAQPEQTGVGWLVDGQRRWLAMLHADMFTPSISGIVDGLQQAQKEGSSRWAAARAFGERYALSRTVEPGWKRLLSLPVDPGATPDG